MAKVGGRNVHICCRTVCLTAEEFGQERQGEAVLLVQEQYCLLYLVATVFKEYRNLSATFQSSVPQPERVRHTAVFVVLDDISDYATVGQILLAGIVEPCCIVAVIHPFICKHAVCTVSVVFQADVKGWINVLASQDVDVRFLSFYV